jgi:hypothetical protein
MKLIKINQLIIVLISFVICGCIDNNKNTETKNANAIIVTKDLSKDKEVIAYDNVITKGDTNSYDLLTTMNLDSKPEDGLFIALVMSNKYNYKPAYYDVYRTLTWAFNQQSGKVSEKEMGEGNYKIAIEHLIKGAFLGDEQCITTIKEYYPELENKIKKH